jgi:signal transduction histidine kinase
VRRYRTPTIRSQLTRVVIAAALPLWLASALLLYQVQREERALIERDAAAAARTVMVAVDRDLASAETAAQVLAESPYLLSDELFAFYAKAGVVARSNFGSNVVLSDATGQQVLNTMRPFGDSLPRHGNPELVQRVFATGKPAISDVYIGAVRKSPVVSIDVPVTRNGSVIYDLSIGIFPDRLGETLQQERLPENWVAAIFDSQGVIVARTRAAAQFVGQKGAPALVEAMAAADEGMVETQTLEGISVSSLFTRSQVSNWAVAIGVPSAELTAPLWRSLGLSAGGTLLLMAIGIVVARLLAERLARPIRSVAEAALACGRGEAIDLAPLGFKEADDLAAALAEGSRLIKERTSERDQAEGERQRVLAANEAAEGAARARSAYFAYLSHELRTPLTAILGYAELIATRTGAITDPKIPAYVGPIEEGARHLMSIVDEILDYAKYEAQEIELHMEKLDVAAELASAVKLMRGRADQCGVTLHLEASATLPPLAADRLRLRQILLNLLSNAIKFTRSGGSVSLSAAPTSDEKLAIRVADSGIGIRAEDLPRVLEPFAQVFNPESRRIEGTGLGLPLTKGLAELHGGTLAIASTEGVGTTVTVTLPLAPEGEASAAGAAVMTPS